jgi:hypothetical protein
MLPSPRVLLSIDYEPWFALTRRYDKLADPQQRCELDGGYTLNVLGPILEMLGPSKASFYLVGEVAEWYPEVPQRIVAAGHELGLHCHIHRRLLNTSELEQDITSSENWRRQYNVCGYRAPMVSIREGAYPLLERAGFRYSSSIYAPTGILVQKGAMWEVPVSTLPVLGGTRSDFTSPRDFSSSLLLNGEIPYGSSFMTGVLSSAVFRIIERELKAGRSPVIFLHPYELVRPPAFLRRMWVDLLTHPFLIPFTLDKSGFLKRLLQAFPTSSLITYLDEALALQEAPHV